MSIKLSKTDGGKVQAGFILEHNDCGVRALAVSTGISYGDAHDMLRERGRRAGRGSNVGWIESSLASLANVGIKFVKQSYGRGTLAGRPTLIQFIRANPTGRFLVITNHHGLTLIDGVIHDADIISGARTRVICSFKVEIPAATKEVPAEAIISQAQINELWERLNKLEARA